MECDNSPATAGWTQFAEHFEGITTRRTVDVGRGPCSIIGRHTLICIVDCATNDWCQRFGQQLCQRTNIHPKRNHSGPHSTVLVRRLAHTIRKFCARSTARSIPIDVDRLRCRQWPTSAYICSTGDSAYSNE